VVIEHLSELEKEKSGEIKPGRGTREGKRKKRTNRQIIFQPEKVAKGRVGFSIRIMPTNTKRVHTP